MVVNSWMGYLVTFLGFVGTIVIRAPHGERSKKVKVEENRKKPVDLVLVGLVSVSMLVLPLLSCFTSVFAFADYSLGMPSLVLGTLLMGIYLWLFHRSHADLGTNWSISLEVRENHSLVDSGVYARVRHPMYTAIFANAIAQTLLVPNWISGPSYFVAFSLLYLYRVGAEEKMMHEKFGQAYVSYMQRTNRLIPSIFFNKENNK